MLLSASVALWVLAGGYVHKPNSYIQATPSQPGVLEETEQGDPNETPERVQVDYSKIRLLLGDKVEKAAPDADRKKLATEMLKTAKSYLKPPKSFLVSRDSTQGQGVINKFVRLMLPDLDYHTRFCALGIAYVAAETYVTKIEDIPANRRPARMRPAIRSIFKDYFPISPLCTKIVSEAKDPRYKVWMPVKDAHGRFTQPKPGWLVLYNWHPESRVRPAQHVGLVDEGNHITSMNTRLKTVEFNTSSGLRPDGSQSNGGGVYARNDRKLGHVLGYVATY